MCGSAKKSALGVTSSTSAPFSSSGKRTSTPVASFTSSSRPSSVLRSAGPGSPRLLPIVCTLPMISLEYFWPRPTLSMMSRAAMVISAVSMP